MKESDKISHSNPFKVPENYFEEVNRKIISATTGYTSEAEKPSLYRKLRPYLAIAASLAILVIVSYTTVQFFKHDRKIVSLSEINLEEVSETWINDIDILTLEEDAASLVLFENGPGVDKKDIIDYLIRENIDINEIYEQL